MIDCLLPLRYGSRRINQGTVALLLAAVIGASGTSVRADVRVEGDVAAVRLEASHAPLSEVLSALGPVFNVRYRTSIPLDRGIHGTYRGRLERVISRVLDGYNYVLKNEKDSIEIIVLGKPGEAVAVVTPNTVSPAIIGETPKKASPTKDPIWEETKARHRRPPTQRP